MSRLFSSRALGGSRRSPRIYAIAALFLWCAPLLAQESKGSSASAATTFAHQNADAGEQKASSQSDQSARITRVENGLLPAIIIKGQLAPTMTLAERMRHYAVPGVSVAFFEHGQIAWTRVYGFADGAHKNLVTPETLFQAASISKPVSALAALRLVQDGKLDLDEDVNIKLRDWKVPENEFTKEQKVTLRRILSHTAGLTVHGFPGYASREVLPTTIQILNGEKPANTEPIRVDTVPGTQWRYSGGGYVVMQLLLTDVTGKKFPQLVNDLVFQPAGMTHSTCEQPLPQQYWSLAASAYGANGEPLPGGWHTYPELGPACLWTTASDLARLAIEVQNEYAGKSKRIVSPEMMRQMLTRQKDDWGLGFRLETPGQARRFSHGGSNEGYRCRLEAYIDSGQGFVIMTNSDNGEQLEEEVLRAVAKEYNWPDFQPVERVLVKIDPVLLANYAGTYEEPNVGKVTVTLNLGKLYLQAAPIGPNPEELLAESNSEFFLLSHDLKFIFQRDEKGSVSKLTIQVGPRSFEAKKLP